MLDPFPVTVVGGGPAGLRAAEVVAQAGCRVALYEQKASVGRKFLVAGRGGLNLTHSEPVEKFPARYGGATERWRDLLAAFGPDALRAWADELGAQTYVGTSGRVFPRGQQSAGLLRRWVARLRERGVVFHVCQRLAGLDGRRLQFQDVRTGALAWVESRAAVLALGGASWPGTGSDGEWPQRLGLPAAPWQPANCGWEVAWRPEFLQAAEGLPLKNITVSAGERTIAGEALVTRYGLEGGTIYQLGPALRAMDQPRLTIDLKPTFTVEALRRKPAPAWRLSVAARALLEFHGAPGDPAAAAKGVQLDLLGPRPIAEAISSAGGTPWNELTPDLMLIHHPGIFLAGEMIDWEAPTGGYLMQGCLATGERAGHGVLRYIGNAAVSHGGRER